MSDANLIEVTNDVIPLKWRQRAYVALGLISTLLTAVGAGYAAINATAPDYLVAALAVVVSLTGPANVMSRVYARPTLKAEVPLAVVETSGLEEVHHDLGEEEDVSLILPLGGFRDPDDDFDEDPTPDEESVEESTPDEELTPDEEPTETNAREA